jgi:hypothetical protein
MRLTTFERCRTLPRLSSSSQDARCGSDARRRTEAVCTMYVVVFEHSRRDQTRTTSFLIPQPLSKLLFSFIVFSFKDIESKVTLQPSYTPRVEPPNPGRHKLTRTRIPRQTCHFHVSAHTNPPSLPISLSSAAVAIYQLALAGM